MSLMAPKKPPSNWLSAVIRERRANEANKWHAKREDSEDKLFRTYVVECQGSSEFDLVIESGYLCNYRYEGAPETVRAAGSKYGFVNAAVFVDALKRWVRLNPPLFEVLEQKSQTKRKAYDDEKIRKVEESRMEHDKWQAKYMAEAQIAQEARIIRKLESLQNLKSSYLISQQTMIEDARVFRDLAEKLERCKRRSSRKKWRKELSENRFAQYLEVGLDNQAEYKKVVLSGVFDRKGIDFDGPGLVYLMRNQSLNALKIGITSNSSTSDRVSVHENKGWGLLSKWEFSSTWQAYLIEQQIISWWRDELELGNGVAPEQMPQGGFSETAPNSADLQNSTVLRVEELLSQTDLRDRKVGSKGRNSTKSLSSGCWCGGKWVARKNGSNKGTFRSCSRWPYCLNRPDRPK
jgi:hypothetical protein